MTKPLNNLVCVSDLHAGCRLALCPPKVRLDDGGTYHQSALQRKIYKYWQIFWEEFVPESTRGEPYDILINGDMTEGVHHRATTQISQNMSDQKRIAYELVAPLRDKCRELYIVRGTEAHVGASGEYEEELARMVGAKPNKEGQYARYDLWKYVGPKLVNALHHVGTTGSQAYESTAVHKELVEAFVEAGRWNRRPPDCIVRSHRHRDFETSIPTGGDHGETGRALAIVLGCWQGKTPFTWKIPGARLATPQFGGVNIRYAHNRLFADHKVWTVERSDVE